MTTTDQQRPIGEEARKAHAARLRSGFVNTYLSGQAILDIGYRGYLPDAVPVVPGAIGIDLDYPGYDGLRLPFGDGTQDAVFVSHCLEHITDFGRVLRDWFRVLKIGGYLLIMVPHQFLYEKRLALPSRYNAGHKRFYTPASLMAEIEASLAPNTYRVRHLADNDADFDYSIPPDRHAGGCYEIELVLEKISPPDWRLAGDDDAASPAASLGSTAAYTVQTTRLGHPAAAPARILLLKLDHLGDFIIGLPSLRRLRAAFPTTMIRMVVGSWNAMSARACGLVDDVVTYDYFPPDARGWDGTPHEALDKFRAVTAGRYDLAIDLRADEDTRFLLKHVEAGLRCGTGSRSRQPFLDVILPAEYDDRRHSATAQPHTRLIGPEQFESRMRFKSAFYHETEFPAVGSHVIYGPNLPLPLGRWKATFGLQLRGLRWSFKKSSVVLDVARDGGEIVALRRLRLSDFAGPGGHEPALEFINDSVASRYEFRVFAAGAPVRTLLRFSGVRLDHEGAPVVPRFRPAELHIGERLLLLIQLIIDRIQPSPRQAAPHQTRSPQSRRIVVAPFSNSYLRDWPARHYVTLLRSLLSRLDCTITLIGSRAQAEGLAGIATGAGNDPRIINLGGETAWSEIPDLLRDADLVICNNSGIAHLAAELGALTLAIFSASHQPREWGPRGPRAYAMMAVLPCSPCGHDRLDACTNDHACMTGLSPAEVFAQACALLEQA